MADLIKEREVLEQQEQKKSKKLLYKNWKLYASALGIVVIGTGIGLGIYYGVTANQSEPATEITSQQIVEEINKQELSLANIEMGSTADTVKAAVNADFFKQQLAKEFQEAFNADLFSAGTIMVQELEQEEHELVDSDLAKEGTINATIGYTYDSITGQELALTINVVKDGITERDIADEINKGAYESTVAIRESAQNVEATINTAFFKAYLSEEIQAVFDETLFSREGKIMVQESEAKEHALTDDDLVITGTINAKVTYNYGEVKAETVALTLNVAVTQQQIVDEIATKNYTVTAESKDADSVKNQITADFIQEKLTDEFNTAFTAALFKDAKIMVGEEELNNTHLNEATDPINATINYTYGTLTEQTTNLTINITWLSSEKILTEIENVTYEATTSAGSSVDTILEQLTADFIQEQLTGNFHDNFDKNLFKIINVMVNNEELSDEHLVEATDPDAPRTATINFTYDGITGKTTLAMTITET